MKELSQAASAASIQKMTSIEIAKLTGKRHDNVKSDIERILAEVGIDFLEFKEVSQNKQNQSVKHYSLPKRECDLVVSGYVTKYRLAIIDRWQELENNQPTIPQSLPEALRLAADTMEQNQQLTHEVETMRPDVAALERIAKADGSMTITEASKNLQVRLIDLTKWLSMNKWLYKRSGAKSWLGYQDRIQAGLIEHKVSVFERKDGTEKVTTQARITPKGITKLSVQFGGAA